MSANEVKITKADSPKPEIVKPANTTPEPVEQAPKVISHQHVLAVLTSTPGIELPPRGAALFTAYMIRELGAQAVADLTAGQIKKFVADFRQKSQMPWTALRAGDVVRFDSLALRANVYSQVDPDDEYRRRSTTDYQAAITDLLK